MNNKDIRSEAANTDAELEIGPDYLIEKTSIGKGVFLSEHLSETEVFIGQLLIKTVEDRGSIPEEKRQFFSDWAEEQLKQTNWEPLGEEWTADLYTYDRSYMLNYLYGDVGYDFFYSFYQDEEKNTSDKVETVNVQAFVDSNGIIRSIGIEIAGVSEISADVVSRASTNSLFCDEF